MPSTPVFHYEMNITDVLCIDMLCFRTKFINNVVINHQGNLLGSYQSIVVDKENSQERNLNLPPPDLQTGALPTELTI